MAAKAEQAGAGAPAEKIAGCLPIPVRLMPGLDPAAAHFARPVRPTRAGFMCGRGRIGIAGLVVKIIEARLGTELAVHAKMLLLTAQQPRHVAVRIVDIAELQRVGDAGIDASWRRARLEPGVKPFARPKSMRSEQNVHFCATPRRLESSRSISFCIASAP